MFTGKIKSWNSARGFGFIAPDDGKPDVFAHIKNVNFNAEPAPGLCVRYDIVCDDRSGRDRADRIRLA
jgi:CspA family cold shock protein